MDAFILLAAAAFAALALFAWRIERDTQVAGPVSNGAPGDPPPMRLDLLAVSPAQFAAYEPAHADEAARLAVAAARPPAALVGVAARLEEAA